MRAPRTTLFFLLLSLSDCAPGEFDDLLDAGEVAPRTASDAGTNDAGRTNDFDAGVANDAGTARDAGTTHDAGTAHDAGMTHDAGTVHDAGTTTDAGLGPTDKTISYTEPTTASAAAVCTPGTTSLTNLKQTNIFYKVGNGAPILAATVPATAATGGGNISKRITLPSLAHGAVVEFWVTATDTTGNESALACSEHFSWTAP